MPTIALVPPHLTSVFQAPVAWRDHTTVLSSFDQDSARPYVNKVVSVEVRSIHNVRKASGTKGRQHTKMTLRDHTGIAMVCGIFGEYKTLLDQATKDVDDSGYTILSGLLKPLGNTLLLCDPEHVPLIHRGKIIPLYPPKRGKRPVQRPEKVTNEQIAAASEVIRDMAFKQVESKAPLLLNVPFERSVEYFSRALSAVHHPTDVGRAERASQALNRVGAWIAVKGMIDQRTSSMTSKRATKIATWLSIEDLQARAKMKLTDEQQAAIKDICHDISCDAPMERLLSGDTGSGKTPVYGLAAIAAAHAGAVVAVLCPSEYLARQVHRAISSWASDMEIVLCLGGGTRQHGQVMVGTTAMLHDVTIQPNLVIIDEQQAFGVEQRRALLTRISGHVAHLLEVTATCVPRSQAIAEMGLLKVSRLTKCHVEKAITTTHYDRKHGGDLFAVVRETITAGGKVLVIYPAKAAPASSPEPEDKAGQQLFSVIKERANWEKHFPGRVGVVYGAVSTDEAAANQAAIDAFSNGKLDVLLSTTVLERGVDIPDLMHVVVMQPDRFGLSQLHQIRGRAARKGGVGRCDLYSPYPVAAAAKARIQALIDHTDGWMIAAADLSDRGCGDISYGSHQHGDIVTPFSSLSLTQEDLSEVSHLLLGSTPQ